MEKQGVGAQWKSKGFALAQGWELNAFPELLILNTVFLNALRMIFPLLFSWSDILKTVHQFCSSASGKWGLLANKQTKTKKWKIKQIWNVFEEEPIASVLFVPLESPYVRFFVNDCTKQHAGAVTANPSALCNVSWQHLKCCSIGCCGCYVDWNRFNERLWSQYWKPVFREGTSYVAVWMLTLKIRIVKCSYLEDLLNTERRKNTLWSFTWKLCSLSLTLLAMCTTICTCKYSSCRKQ